METLKKPSSSAGVNRAPSVYVFLCMLQDYKPGLPAVAVPSRALRISQTDALREV